MSSAATTAELIPVYEPHMIHTIERQWPPVKKSRAMIALEHWHGEDIRSIILSRLRMYQSNKIAAVHVGVSQSLLSHWIVKLGIYDEAREIRFARYHQL